jgi:hypothetical protein
MAKKTPRQLGNSRRKKSRKLLSRREHEAQMMELLLSKGWKRSGPNGDVWVTESWKPYRESYGFERGYVKIQDLDGEGFKTVYSKREPKNWRTDKVSMTLHNAYKNQLRLDASGYERPKGLDDDLADLI